MTVWGRHGSMLTGSLFPLVFGGLEYQGKLGKTRENMPLLAGEGNQACILVGKMDH